MTASSLGPCRFIGLGLNRVWLSAGDVAFNKGDQASCLFVLISGRIRITSGEGRRGIRLRTLWKRDH